MSTSPLEMFMPAISLRNALYIDDVICMIYNTLKLIHRKNHCEKQKTAGFSLIGILIVFVTVGTIGALSYAVYKNHLHEKEASLTDAVEVMESLPGLVTGAPLPPNSGMAREKVATYSSKYREVPGLAEALKSHETDRPCIHLEGRFKQYVLGVTSDQTQALIGSGCGGAGMVRSFMIKQGDSWTRVGSWNQKFGDGKNNFNVLLDTPSCDVTEEYNIQKSIAPVCFEENEGQSDLFAGDIAKYTYILR